MRKAFDRVKIKETLEEALELPVHSAYDASASPLEPLMSQASHWPFPEQSPDLILQAGEFTFVLEYKRDASLDQAGAASRQLRAYVGHLEEAAIPLLVVPYMGADGKGICKQYGVSWIDLSGNADIRGPGLRIRLEGQPSRFKRQGRHRDLFAPASSRLARVLLTAPTRAFLQSELITRTELSPGTVSQLVRRYADAGFLERQKQGRQALWSLARPNELLNAWVAGYDFSLHAVHRGHIPARSGPELLRHVREGLDRHGTEYAVTGLAGAWVLEPFASFRLLTVYLRRWPPAEVLATLGFRDEPRGANTWLVVPNDRGVFYNASTAEGIRHVDPVQIYLDLKGQPERSEEAAEELRRSYLNWGRG